jgi:2'-hydroxyisoflavone reductase
MHRFMNILLLGGTQFLGRHIADALLTAGHRVTTFNRGRTPDALPAEVQRLRGDRNDGAAGLEALQGKTWDACVDLSGYTPRQVRPSAAALCERVGRYVFISAVSVYGDPQQRPVREDQPLLPPAAEGTTEIDAATYGPLKVACEDILLQMLSNRCTLLRPQVVAGPHDPFDRYSYWVRRATKPGPILAPGDGRDHVQVIDVRDLARFTCTVIENNLAGVFNLAGPRLSWAEFLSMLGATDLVWTPSEIIRAAGVMEFELPLFRPERGPRSGLMDVCNTRAQANGLTLTPPEITARDVRAWIATSNLAPALPPEREMELIRRVRRAAAPPS